jgi:hypothetical protein
MAECSAKLLKAGPTKLSLAGKSEGRTMAKFKKKCQKISRKTFLKLFRSKPIKNICCFLAKHVFQLFVLTWSVYKLSAKFFL